jgi:hypothetical protein
MKFFYNSLYKNLHHFILHLNTLLVHGILEGINKVLKKINPMITDKGISNIL